MNLRTYLMIKSAAKESSEGWWDFIKRKGRQTGKYLKGDNSLALRSLGGAGLGALGGNAISEALGFDDDYGIGGALGAAGGGALGMYGPKLWSKLVKAVK